MQQMQLYAMVAVAEMVLPCPC